MVNGQTNRKTKNLVDLGERAPAMKPRKEMYLQKLLISISDSDTLYKDGVACVCVGWGGGVQGEGY